MLLLELLCLNICNKFFVEPLQGMDDSKQIEADLLLLNPCFEVTYFLD